MVVMSKICTRCAIKKPLEGFSGHPKALDGKQSQCKGCVAERARLKRVNRPCEGCNLPMDSNVVKGKRRCNTCLQKCTSCGINGRLHNQRICTYCQKTSDALRKSSDEVKFANRVTRISSKYKVRKPLAISMAAFTHCEACDKVFNRTGEHHIDHCHATGFVRGVLCFNCNAALGHLNDNPWRLEKLINYLKEKETFMHKDDLEKAKHFIELLIELETKKVNDNH